MQRFRTEPVSVSPTQQYDGETARQILARAREIEQSTAQEANTVSAAQIEALAGELGISPDAVRRALGERSAGASVAPVHTHASRTLPPLTKRDIKAAFVPGLWYAPMVGMFLSWFLVATKSGGAEFNSSVLWAIVAYFLVFFAAPLLAALHGWRTRDYRQGLIAGAATAVLCGATIAVVFAAGNGSHTGNESFYRMLMMSVVATLLLGMPSGISARWWHSLHDSDQR
jgi:hypothetical protein